eukprot:9492956-Pyramimonas_sp.AAC.1
MKRRSLEESYHRALGSLQSCYGSSSINNAEQHHRHAQTLLLVEGLPTKVVLTLGRLRLLPRVVCKGPPVLRCLLDMSWRDPDGWAALIREDFSWLKLFVPEVPPGDLERSPWAQPPSWRGILRGGVRSILAAAIRRAKRYYQDQASPQ